MQTFSIKINPKEIRNQLLNYSKEFDSCFFYDSNADENEPFPLSYRSYDILVGLGTNQKVTFNNKQHFEQLEAFQNKHKTWLFGYLSYDLKNEIEALSSNNDDILVLPLAQFVEPQLVIAVNRDIMKIHVISKSFDAPKIAEEINSQSTLIEPFISNAAIHHKTGKEDYFKAFEQFKKEIAYGNIYEVNYCIAFETTLHSKDWIALYNALNEISKAPFSAYVRVNQTVTVSASPERFIKKQGLEIISQPIKGTAKRGKTLDDDAAQVEYLKNSSKEKSENVMITDLVRNDLSKNAARNSVVVKELFGIYSFKQVHQMISTVTAQLNDDKNYVRVIKDAFPMGSMTGAPKIMAMQLIEQHEQMKRGLYSGALGYIDPNNNYDFNVLIRSVFINAATGKARFCVGSAITAKANAEDEYQECLLKAGAIFKVLA